MRELTFLKEAIPTLSNIMPADCREDKKSSESPDHQPIIDSSHFLQKMGPYY